MLSKHGHILMNKLLHLQGINYHSWFCRGQRYYVIGISNLAFPDWEGDYIWRIKKNV